MNPTPTPDVPVTDMHARDLGQAPSATCEPAPRPTWRDRLRWKFFPMEVCPLPELPGSRDCVKIRTVCVLSFADRLRLLASGRLEVICRTCTENEVGETATSSVCYPLAPEFLER